MLLSHSCRNRQTNGNGLKTGEGVGTPGVVGHNRPRGPRGSFVRRSRQPSVAQMNVGPTVLCHRHFYVNSTCLESPTGKTDRSSRTKIMTPTFGWTGNPPSRGPNVEPRSGWPRLAGFFLANTRSSGFHRDVWSPTVDLAGPPFAHATRSGRSTDNVYGVIKICVAHGDFVHLAAIWAFDLEPRLPRRA
jgi:hypothetical protein